MPKPASLNGRKPEFCYPLVTEDGCRFLALLLQHQLHPRSDEAHRWVCENHPRLSWPDDCDCGAGAPRFWSASAKCHRIGLEFSAPFPGWERRSGSDEGIAAHGRAEGVHY